MATKTVEHAPKLEEVPFPPFAGQLVGEVLTRCQRELDALVLEIAKQSGVSLAEGWRPDLQGGRFVRQAPGEAGED